MWELSSPTGIQWAQRLNAIFIFKFVDYKNGNVAPKRVYRQIEPLLWTLYRVREEESSCDGTTGEHRADAVLPDRRCVTAARKLQSQMI